MDRGGEQRSALQAEHFGILVNEQIPWLLQGTGGQNALGLRSPCPILPPARVSCGHSISLELPPPSPTDWGKFRSIWRDPLIQAMLPVPQLGSRGFFLVDESDQLSTRLVALARLTSPTTQVVQPIWMTTSGDFKRAIRQTNIQPLVMTQVSVRDQRRVSHMARGAVYHPRTLILTGGVDVLAPSPLRRISSDLLSLSAEDLNAMPLERIGAEIIRRQLRREELT